MLTLGDDVDCIQSDDRKIFIKIDRNLNSEKCISLLRSKLLPNYEDREIF